MNTPVGLQLKWRFTQLLTALVHALLGMYIILPDQYVEVTVCRQVILSVKLQVIPE